MTVYLVIFYLPNVWYDLNIKMCPKFVAKDATDIFFFSLYLFFFFYLFNLLLYSSLDIFLVFRKIKMTLDFNNGHIYLLLEILLKYISINKSNNIRIYFVFF